MRIFFLLCLLSLSLGGCISSREMQLMVEGLQERRQGAERVIAKGKFGTEELLEAQEYFFEIAERVHLTRVDEEARKVIGKLVKRTGPSEFAARFLVSRAAWQRLENHCRSFPVYACSFEIQRYPEILSAFRKLLDPELAEGISAATGFR